MRLGGLRLLAVATGLVSSLLAAAPAPGNDKARAKAGKEGVATESLLASRAALATLRGGGTAADAAVTAALVAGVVSPSSSGLGGGGFALVWQARESAATILDFRETAPAVLDVDAFDRRPLPAAERGKLVGVPGESLGLFELHRRFGKRPWQELVAPAERLAREGFAVEGHLAGTLADKGAENYRRAASIDRSFWIGGKPAVAGARVTRKALARTLARLKSEGPRSIQEGAIAQELVTAARAFGSGITREDLAAYRVRERKPLRFEWEGHEVLTMPPPSAGGVLLAEVLRSYGARELAEMGARTPLRVHLVVEAMRGAFADRARYLGDPDYLPVDVERLIAPSRIAARKAGAHPDRTRTIRALAGEDHGTHAIVVADAAGNVVSLTTTVNTAFGAEIEGETSGILLNDELDDFTSRKMTTGLGISSPPNQARPLVRPTSSMTPTLVLRSGRPRVALGGSGGPRIPVNLTQVLLALLADGESPEAAVSGARFRPGFGEFTLAVESAFSSADVADLKKRGEVVQSGDDSASAIQVLSFDADGLRGAADPRKHGAALVR
ncbi:MAG TPA: gamma-glutamyltransferase [Polyangiaceae bacterium]